jgi:hypothetical protein
MLPKSSWPFMHSVPFNLRSRSNLGVYDPMSGVNGSHVTVLIAKLVDKFIAY